QRRDSGERAEDAGGAAHVELHLVHLGTGLERDAAGVERDPLADEDDRSLRLGGAVVARDDEARRLLRALRGGEERAHAELLYLPGGEHLALRVDLLAELLRRRAEPGRRALVARAVAELARQRHPGGDRLALFDALLDRLLVGFLAVERHRARRPGRRR